MAIVMVLIALLIITPLMMVAAVVMVEENYNGYGGYDRHSRGSNFIISVGRIIIIMNGRYRLIIIATPP